MNYWVFSLCTRGKILNTLTATELNPYHAIHYYSLQPLRSNYYLLIPFCSSYPSKLIVTNLVTKTREQGPTPELLFSFFTIYMTRNRGSRLSGENVKSKLYSSSTKSNYKVQTVVARHKCICFCYAQELTVGLFFLLRNGKYEFLKTKI